MVEYIYRQLLGFDIRLMPEDYVEIRWSQDVRDIFLLRPEIKWPLSVDLSVWPSFFRYWKDSFSFIERINIIPVDFRQQALDLWSSLERMKDYFFKEGKPAQNGLMIAIVLETQQKTLLTNEYWGAVLDPILPINMIPTEWLCLGYDVADQYMLSGLSNCGYNVSEKLILQKTWATRLNEYGLFKNLEDAIEFTTLSEQRVPAHAPFYVYSLYQDVNKVSARS